MVPVGIPTIAARHPDRGMPWSATPVGSAWSPIPYREATMRVLLSLICAVSLAVAADAPPAVADADTTDWKLVWSDEFDHDGVPDPGKWDFEHGFVRNQELQWYQPENAVCRDGLLVIEARREHKPNPDFKAGSAEWGERRESIEYTSACLVTKGKKDFRYGKFEMRARIDTRLGGWPAVWTPGTAIDRVGWPGCGRG